MFPADEIAAAGYRAIASGQKTYNGVAVIAKAEPADPVTDFPGFEDPQRRILASTIDGVRVVNLYVPNGSEVGSEKYAYKLSWLDALHGFLDAELKSHDKLVVLGDFNIAPADEDVYDAEKWGDAHTLQPEGARGAGEAHRPWAQRRFPQVRAARENVQLVGLSRGGLSPQCRASNRPDPGVEFTVGFLYSQLCG